MLPRLLSIACLAASVLGQDESLRGPALGMVRDAFGTPWASVEVVLVSRPLPQNPDVGEEDCVRVSTDAGGRFTAQILDGRPYSAWAWGKEEGGARRASNVVEQVFVRRSILLEEKRSVRSRSLRLAHLDRWSAHAPFEVRVIDGTENRRVFWSVVANDGAVALPLLVGPSAWVEVFGTKPCRYPITRTSVDTSASDDVVIDLPERTALTCWARSFELARACGGARVLIQLGDTLHEVGVSDALGRLTLDLPAALQPASPKVFVVADQHMFANCLPLQPAFEDAIIPAGAAPADICASLLPGSTLHGRVLDQNGEPLACAQLSCSGLALHRPSRSSGASAPWRRTVITDARGEFAIHGVGPSHPPSVHLVLSERDFAALPPRWRPGLAPVVFAPLVGQDGAGTKESPVVVDLRRMCPIELDVSDHTGAPADGVEVSFVCFTQFVVPPWGWGARDAVAAPRGRLRILIPGGQRFGVRAVRDLSMLIRAFETSPGRPAAGPASLRFALPAPLSIQGTLTNKDGAPASEYELYACFGTSNTPAEWSYSCDEKRVPADPLRNAVRVFLPEQKSDQLRLTDLISRRVTTDSAGRFALPMPPDSIPDLLIFANKVGGSRIMPESLHRGWSGQTQSGIEWQLRE